jgi:hypothetical protein
MTTPTNTPAPSAPAAPEAPKPGTPEHDAAMAKKFEGGDAAPNATPDPAKPQKPEGIPDKFWNAEKGEVDVAGLAKSYSELEKARTKAPEPKPVAPEDVAKKALEDAVSAAKAKPGATYAEVKAAEDALAAYKPSTTPAPSADTLENISAQLGEILLNNDGEMTEEGYKLAEKHGMSRALVDAHVAGQVALAREYERRTFEAAGSEQTYRAMVTWAKTGVPAEEARAFNAAITSGDEAAMRLAVQGLHTKYVAANGQKPNLLGGERSTVNQLAFRDKSEMTTAMRDPRYKTSEAYRKDVAARLAATDW